MKKILLSRGFEALVDDEDYPVLMDRKWYAQGKGMDARYIYAATRNGEKKVLMHKYIMEVGPEPGRGKSSIVVDHINGDTLDNRRSNLRIVTKRENALNRRGSLPHVSHVINGLLGFGA